ncbi:MAG: hypothetical protein MI923_00690 [Phycisphaerales bacterium]|nr:hypothetical protein [Phycisphaerales bacterium]
MKLFSIQIAVTAGFCVTSSVLGGPVPSFQGLGDLTGGAFHSSARGVSPDGQVVVGQSMSTLSGSAAEAFRWTRTGGIEALGTHNGGTSGVARAASQDGSVIVGTGSSSNSVLDAFRWTVGTGVVSLGDLPGGTFNSDASAVSADGSVIVGSSRSGSFESGEAFRWTESTGMVGLGALPGGTRSSAAAVSADGQVIAGQVRLDNVGFSSEAFVWRESTGMVGLGDLPGGLFRSEALGISADGSVVVGSANGATGTEAVRWTEQGGISPLGISGSAQAVSADGSVIVGGTGSAAFVWDAERGLRNLQIFMATEFGLSELAGWNLNIAHGISADGTTIVGTGTNPAGQTEGWIAVIPEPATGLLLTLWMFLMLTRRHGLARTNRPGIPIGLFSSGRPLP